MGEKKEKKDKRGSDCKWVPTQTRTALVRWTRVQQGPQVSQQMHFFNNLYQLLLVISTFTEPDQGMEECSVWLLSPAEEL